jgi:hypothetical protein
VCGVERVCKGEPGTESFVISRLDVYVVSFESWGRCRKINQDKSRNILRRKNLTRKVIPLWHVVLREERTFEVVHEEEPEMRARNRCHTTS